MQELIDLILEWWEKHQYDTTDRGEYNVFDEPPEFVVLAKKLKSTLTQ